MSAPEQLDLFSPVACAAAGPCWFVACDHETGRPLFRVDADEIGWDAAAKWCWLAQGEWRDRGTIDGTMTAFRLFYGLQGIRARVERPVDLVPRES